MPIEAHPGAGDTASFIPTEGSAATGARHPVSVIRPVAWDLVRVRRFVFESHSDVRLSHDANHHDALGRFLQEDLRQAFHGAVDLAALLDDGFTCGDRDAVEFELQEVCKSTHGQYTRRIGEPQK